MQDKPLAQPKSSPSRSEIQRRLKGLLQTSQTLTDILNRLEGAPLSRWWNACVGLAESSQPEVRQRAAQLGGLLIHLTAAEGAEAARVMMRRLMWNLSEESGNCSVGAVTMMASAAAANESISAEFGDIILSYIDEEGNYLEHPTQLAAAILAAAELAAARTEQLPRARALIAPHARHRHPDVAAAAVRALVLLRQRQTGGM